MSRRIRFRCYLPLCLLAASCNSLSPAEEAETSALLRLTEVRLMPYGRKDGTCIRDIDLKLKITDACTHSETPFAIEGAQLKIAPGNGACVDVQNADPAAGIVGIAPCNGTNAQKWDFSNGRIKSFLGDYCLDVRFGLHSPGSELGVAPCNGTGAQTFWMANVTLDIRSQFSVSTGSQTCAWECLDVLFDNEQPGTGLNNFNCNGTNAQWFVFDILGHIRLANKPNLLIGLNGPVQGGVAPIALQNYTGDPRQEWFLLSPQEGGPAIRNRTDNLCLDVQGGSSTPGTPVNAFTCNGTNAQKWGPRPDVPPCFVP